MNFYLLFWLLLPFLAIVNGGNFYFDLVAIEAPTDEFASEPKVYSTKADHNPFHSAPTADDDDDVVDEDDSFLGTTLFQDPRKQCFTLDEISLLRARQSYERVVPKSYPKYLTDNRLPLMMVRHWNVVNQVGHYLTDEKTERVVEHALYDTMGAYLHYYLVPVAQLSYYAGRVSLRTVEQLVTIKRECHDMLNTTTGNGWRMPAIHSVEEQLKGLEIEPVQLGINASLSDGSNICDLLDMSGVSLEANDPSQVLLPMPSLAPLDANGHLTNIYLPFRGNHVYNLRSASSATELKSFLDTIVGCHKFLNVNPAQYNRKLLEWIQEFVPRHLLDEPFYPGLEGILQIKESLLQGLDNYGKQSRSIRVSSGKREREQEQEQDQDQDGLSVDERLFVVASIVLTVAFLTALILLQCGRLQAEKKTDNNRSHCESDDVEMGEFTPMPIPMAMPKRVTKKVKIETPRTPPRKMNSERRYYCPLSQVESSDDRSTSTLGYQFREKIMPFHFEKQHNYKYSPLSSQRIDDVEPSFSELQFQDKVKRKKRSGRGK